ncbi:MAG: hypothetical protein P8Y75_08940 [Nitrospirota bacterium]
MKKHFLSVEDFKRYIPRVKCINLFHYNLIGTPKLEEVSRVEKLRYEEPAELESLQDDKLAWYVNDRDEPVSWNAEHARNLAVGEQASRLLARPEAMEGHIRDMVDSLRGGLTNTLELVSVYDTILRERVIVDGMVRVVALLYLYRAEPETVQRLFRSEYEICSVVYTSPAGSLLFPCDFINILREYDSGSR